MLEGFIDLVFRDESGGLVIVDYKTDTVRDAAALAERATYYEPQLRRLRAGARGGDGGAGTGRARVPRRDGGAGGSSRSPVECTSLLHCMQSADTGANMHA